ncbi:hypothetical protein L1987_37384 [Smallanthus sonchifolius]|uniref:Uncharacterized protein n=1 Tax=Smallanthus sonchifolius TaxID=185202 RepID=A0ACB9HGM5_9ASTR|nr:hypothetical protein L1987_37384 [Smallanthus sonchifolius]
MILLRASFFNTPIQPFPRKSATDFPKYFCGKLSGLRSAAFSTSASYPVVDEEDEGISKSYKPKGLSDSGRIYANHQTYCWLLEGYLSSGSLTDAKKLHGRILKSGFDRDNVICSRLAEMLADNVDPDEVTFANVLRSCSGDRIDHCDIKQIHTKIVRHGFGTNYVVCNPLIDLYAKRGYIDTAKNVFQGLTMRDNVTWVAMISGLSQNGHEKESILLFFKMHDSGILPTPYVFSSVISSCLGEQLHALIHKWGFSSETFVCNALVTLYSRCGDLFSAERIFSKMDHRDGVSYNTLISGLAQKGLSEKALQLYENMQSDALKPDSVTIHGLRPNQYTYPSILRTCTAVSALDLGEQIHSHVVKTGFQLNVYVCSVLIDMYSKHGDLHTAQKILNRLNEKDVVSWTAMIAGYAQHDLFDEALKTFEEMLTIGIQPDNIGFSSAISACAGIQAINQGRQIHGQSIVCGYSSDLSIGNALVCLYARCGLITEAYLAFEKINLKDNVSWNALVSGFAQSGNYEESLKVFSKMNEFGVEVNMFTYGSAVSAAANTTNITQGKQIHGRMIKTGYSQHGCGEEAIELFEEMKRFGYTPNYVTFVGVLTACSHVRLVDKGLEYFNSMSQDYGLVPLAEHYACVVDILGRAGLLIRALEFIKSMPIEPDPMVWRTLLSACTVHKNKEIGEISAKHLLELEPEDSATYVLLSNMYAVSGKWDDRNRTRKLMKDRGVKKVPGRSWIEIKNTVHAFFVGDRLHPLADEIYEYLDVINKRAADIGYVQDRYSLLNDLEQELKDPSTCIHSEKLAITFGLFTLSNNIPLRVMKNLRVCNDCHNWIKSSDNIETGFWVRMLWAFLHVNLYDITEQSIIDHLGKTMCNG